MSHVFDWNEEWGASWWPAMKFRRRPRGEPDTENECWEVSLTPALRDSLLKFLGGEGVHASEIKAIHQRVLEARKLNLPMIDFSGEWKAIEAEAKRQGIPISDALWDAMGRRG